MEISTSRLNAVPTAELCIDCAREDDVPRVKGAMSWEHKTAPELIIGDDADYLLKNSRRGFHAQLPLNAKENPRLRAYVQNCNVSEGLNIKERPVEEPEYESVRFIPARCHPDQPSIGPTGLCPDCAAQWYLDRRRK